MARALADQETPAKKRGRPHKKVAEPVAEPVAEQQNGRKTISDGHLAALAAGRDEGRVVRRYLEAMTGRPYNGRHRDPDFLKRKIKRLDDQIPHADVLSRLGLIQQRLTAQRELDALGDAPEDLGDMEEAFVAVALAYSKRKGITYQAWRTVGVTPEVLRRAGITRIAN